MDGLWDRTSPDEIRKAVQNAENDDRRQFGHPRRMSAQPEVPSADLFRHPPLLLFVASHNFSQLAYAVDETVPVAAQGPAPGMRQHPDTAALRPAA